MKKTFSFLFVITLVLGLAPGATAQEGESFKLTIMHTNDTHAQHEPDQDGSGGVVRQATVVKQIRAEATPSLLVDAGDRFTGTLFHLHYLGQDNVQIMNLLGYDVMTLGNHEFDNGQDVLAAFLDGVNFPVVSANIDFSASPLLAGKVPPYVVLEAGGERIGIIGAITPDTDILALPGENLAFDADVAGVVQAAVDELTADGIDKIILLTHLGYWNDLPLAREVSGVDVIVGGHSHTILSNRYPDVAGEYPTVVESPAGEPVLIVQAGQKNIYLGRLDVTFDAAGVVTDWGGDLILLSSDITPDAEMAALLATLVEPIAELRQTPVGESAMYLGLDLTTCRMRECRLGNLIADAIREHTGADIALQNGGGIRTHIAKGVVTVGDVLAVLPFGNLVSTFSLSGADVWEALETGVSQAETGAGRFPQVSGLRFSWDGSVPPGHRIVSVDVLDAETGEFVPLDLEAVYYVAANDYMRGGGDGYWVVADNAIDPYDFGSPLDAVVADYIAANSPIAPELEGRITRVDR
jgi:5'-nucleotidase/UDP-sugar diphosphatase